MLKLILAIAMVESTMNPAALGDYNSQGQAQAVGLLQIHNAVIQDVNRVYKTDYVSADRLDPIKSQEIFVYYVTYWAQKYEKKTGLAATDEVRARIWNGGPSGYKKDSTKKYWQKVNSVLQSNKQESTK